jgi:hypothetical protein
VTDKGLTILALAGTVVLTGCFEDQKRQLLSCQLDAEKVYPFQPNAKNQFDDKWSIFQPRAGFLLTCMQAHGYVRNEADDRCPVTLFGSSNLTESYCYRPDYWLGQASYILETQATFCGVPLNPLTGEKVHEGATAEAKAKWSWCNAPSAPAPASAPPIR